MHTRNRKETQNWKIENLKFKIVLDRTIKKVIKTSCTSGFSLLFDKEEQSFNPES